MPNLPEHRGRSWLTELSDAFGGFPSLRALADESHLIRLEEEVQDGHYLVRAEIPGVDPAKDVDVTVSDNKLTIKAERTEKKETRGRSEFSYGSFVRTITLPSGANADDIKATYGNGILTVDVTIPKESAPEVKHVAVAQAK